MRKICVTVFLISMLFVILTKQTTIHDLSAYKSETMQVEVKGEVLYPRRV